MDNRVEIIVGARDMTKADLDSLRARLDEFGKRVATAKVDINDKAAQATLLRLADQFRRLDKRVTPEIDMRGFARAELQLAAMNRSLDNLGSAGGSSGGLLGLGRLIGMIPASAPMWGVLAVAVAAVGTALAPVLAAVIPITIGFGGLALVAKNVLTPVFTALGESGKKLAATMKTLSPAQQQLVREAEPLKDAFGKLAKAVQPEIIKAFAEAIRIVKQLMPALEPLMKAAGKAVDAFLHQLLDWLKSPSGKAFIQWLQVDGPRDIKIFGRVMWDTAAAVGVALDHIYRAGVWLDEKLHYLFTTGIPGSVKVFLDYMRWAWLQIEIFTVRLVAEILDQFSHIPLVGHFFKSAADQVHAELARIEGDSSRTWGAVQRDIAGLHGKQVDVSAVITASHQNLRGFASGTSGAAPGWAWVGERGPELVRMRGGETVLPHGQSMAITRGYAAGTGFDFTESFRPSLGAFDRMLNAAANSVENALANFVRRKFASLGGTGGASGGSGGAIEALARRMFPWPGYMWTDFTLVENREAGWNMYARNPSSGAYGLAQFINGPSEYYQWGGNPDTAAGQLTGMFNYIRSRYGNPLAAWGHEMSYGWYAGGTRNARPGLAVVGEHGPELVGRGPLVIQVEWAGPAAGGDEFLTWLRKQIRFRAGGNVQLALGR